MSKGDHSRDPARAIKRTEYVRQSVWCEANPYGNLHQEDEDGRCVHCKQQLTIAPEGVDPEGAVT